MSQPPQDPTSEPFFPSGSGGVDPSGERPTTPVPYAGSPGTPMPRYDDGTAAGLTTPVPYAGAPGTPMPQYDDGTAAGLTTPVPYAGAPGTPMPQYDVDSAAGPRDHPNAIIAFILGIFSVVGFAVVGPVAWIMASKALKEIDRPNGPVYTNRGLAVAARVLGIIGTIFLVLGIIALVVFVIVAGTAVSRQGA